MELNKIGGVESTAYYTAAQQAQQWQAQQTNIEAAQEVGAETAAAQNTAAVTRDRVQINTTVTLKNVDTVRAIEQMHTRMNQQIKAVRQTNEIINQQADNIENMTTTLHTIMKNFPPFPMDSKERQELLMSYTSIRHEIMKMMVPPPPPPVYEQVKEMWKSVLGENGQLQPGAVPALQTDSSDSAISDAAGNLGRTGQSLAALSSSITQALFQG